MEEKLRNRSVPKYYTWFITNQVFFILYESLSPTAPVSGSCPKKAPAGTREEQSRVVCGFATKAP